MQVSSSNSNFSITFNIQIYPQINDTKYFCVKKLVSNIIYTDVSCRKLNLVKKKNKFALFPQ